MDLMLAGLLGMTYTVVAMVLMIIGLSNGEPRDVAYEITIAALSGFIGSIVLWGGYRTFARTGPLYLRRESLKDYRCPRCDYDIRHLPGNRCPECGETWGYFELPPK